MIRNLISRYRSFQTRKRRKSLLKQARDFLATHAWGKNTMYNERTGAYCAMGVVYATVLGPEYFSHDQLPPILKQDQAIEIDMLGQLLSDCTPERRDTFSGGTYQPSIIGYNDSPGTTREDVLDVFDCAISKL